MTNISTKWAVEQVPNDAQLFVRVHKSKIEEKDPTTIGLPKPSAFKNTPETGPDLSSDWNKYSTPEESRARIGKEYRYGKIEEFKNPSDFFIISLNVQDIYNLNAEQKIEHSPRQDNFPDELDGSPWNRSHCSIIGDFEERRVRITDIVKWEIPPPICNKDV